MEPTITYLIEAEWRTCVGKLSIIGSDNGLSPGRSQAIIWTSAGILLIWLLGTNFSENHCWPHYVMIWHNKATGN